MNVWDDEAKKAHQENSEELHRKIHIHTNALVDAAMHAVFWVRDIFPDKTIRREFFDGNINVFVMGPLADLYVKELRVPEEHIQIAKIALSNAMKIIYDAQYQERSGGELDKKFLKEEAHNRTKNTLQSEGLKSIGKGIPFVKGLSTMNERILREFVGRVLNHLYSDHDNILNRNG